MGRHEMVGKDYVFTKTSQIASIGVIFTTTYHRAGGIGPAALVLAGPVFSRGKRKILLLQKASNKQSTSVILRLIRLIILSYNR